MTEQEARELLETALTSVTRVAVATGLDGLILHGSFRSGKCSQSTWGIAVDTMVYLRDIVGRMK